jgi:TolA-binding protein
MQATIQQLQSKIEKQDGEISTLKKQLMVQEEKVEQQTQQVQAQVKALEERPAVVNDSGPSALDILAAREQYEVALDLQHHTIFNVRKGLKNEWFQRVVQEFKIVVDNYPLAPEAPESQIRIARAYHRYLDDPANAKAAFQKIIDDYPQCEYVDEAREALAKL